MSERKRVERARRRARFPFLPRFCFSFLVLSKLLRARTRELVPATLDQRARAFSFSWSGRPKKRTARFRARAGEQEAKRRALVFHTLDFYVTIFFFFFSLSPLSHSPSVSSCAKAGAAVSASATTAILRREDMMVMRRRRLRFWLSSSLLAGSEEVLK